VIDFRPVFYIIGVLLVALAGAMLVPALVDLSLDNPDWQSFAMGSAVTLVIAILLLLTNRSEFHNLSLRQAFLLTPLAWLVIAIFGALPLYYGQLGLSYTDAFFEAMSGITTTGATILEGLDGMPPGVLIWRALLQWLGGRDSEKSCSTATPAPA